MNRFQEIAFGVACAVLATGCASVVKHPQVDRVKKVAIISVTLDRIIKNLDDRTTGKSSGMNLLSLAASVAPKKDASTGSNPKDMDNRTKLAEYTAKVYEEALKKVPGWTIVSNDQIIASPEYEAIAKRDATSHSLATLGNSVTGLFQQGAGKMKPILFSAFNMDDEKLKSIKELCAKFGVDGVITVDVELLYKPGFFSAGGTGEASVYAATVTRMINSSGEFAVKFPDQGKEFEANGKTAILAGNVFLTDALEKTYHSAIDKTANHTLAEILEGLNK